MSKGAGSVCWVHGKQVLSRGGIDPGRSPGSARMAVRGTQRRPPCMSVFGGPACAAAPQDFFADPGGSRRRISRCAITKTIAAAPATTVIKTDLDAEYAAGIPTNATLATVTSRIASSRPLTGRASSCPRVFSRPPSTWRTLTPVRRIVLPNLDTLEWKSRPTMCSPIASREQGPSPRGSISARGDFISRSGDGGVEQQDGRPAASLCRRSASAGEWPAMRVNAAAVMTATTAPSSTVADRTVSNGRGWRGVGKYVDTDVHT